MGKQMVTNEFRKYFQVRFVKILIIAPGSGKLQLKVLLNFTSILFDCLLISRVTNCTYNRGFNTCLLYQEVLSMTRPSFLQTRRNILVRVSFPLARFFRESQDKLSKRLLMACRVILRKPTSVNFIFVRIK